MSRIRTTEQDVIFNLETLQPTTQRLESPDLSQYESLGNTELPIYDRKAEIIQTIVDNPITILVAETGAGKSTQVPQYALEVGFETIFLTQPRRRAAINVSERIESELGSVVGSQEAATLVSYQTGAGLTGPYDARIKVVTDGLHLVRDARATVERPNELWIIDEVHEWNQNLEMLIAIGKRRRDENPNFKMVVMSATMDKAKLAKFFTDENGCVPPVIEVAGRMFDVKYTEEPVSTVAKEAAKCAELIFKNPDSEVEANTIQVFVAGQQEIIDTIDKLRTTLPKEILQQTTLIPLHAKMTPEAQAPAYQDMTGVKIVVQTKIGQTSMTIPRTGYVISSGLERRIELNDEGDPGLLLAPISQDDVDQQMGRTGRTCPGTFILTKMDDREKFTSRSSREKHQVPEILRSDIDRLTLFEAVQSNDIAELDSYHMISLTSLERSKRRVRALDGIDEIGNITSIGQRMNQLPLSLPMARAMVHAERNQPAVTGYLAAIAAAKEVGGLRLFVRGGTKNWELLTDEVSSDHLAQLDIFIAIQNMSFADMHTHDLDTNNVIRAREHYNKVAKRVNADPFKPLQPPTDTERDQLRECIAAGSINSIYLPVGEGMYRLLGESVVLREISNRSVTLGSRSALVGDPRRVQIIRAGQSEIKHIIEDATEVTIAEIGKIATHLTRWKPVGFTKRAGKYMQVEQQLLDTVVLSSRELPAESSPMLRATIIEDAKVSPGTHLTELYRIKRSLERLAHKAKNPINRLTEDAINGFIGQAAPETITDPSLLENNLRIFIEEQGISLDHFVAQDERDYINANAPDSISVGEINLGLKYVQGKAIVKKFTLDMIERLDEQDAIRLDDGREVFFVYGDKPRTFQQLKKQLRNEYLI